MTLIISHIIKCKFFITSDVLSLFYRLVNCLLVYRLKFLRKRDKLFLPLPC
uniref:Calmodulin-like n=1 Tax=Parasteatoda tepidariorum TaxID=114398 RepID=A0A2L2Y184_PARTP